MPLAFALGLGPALAGCTMMEAPMVFGDAGKYQYHNCEQLAAAAKASAKREQDLRELIDKAQQEASGFIVSLMAYKTDYLAAEEDLRVIENTARQKNCVTPNSWQSNSVIR
jgi:hypothetical protein